MEKFHRFRGSILSGVLLKPSEARLFRPALRSPARIPCDFLDLPIFLQQFNPLRAFSVNYPEKSFKFNYNKCSEYFLEYFSIYLCML